MELIQVAWFIEWREMGSAHVMRAGGLLAAAKDDEAMAAISTCSSGCWRYQDGNSGCVV